jgi:hypothetical protein
VKISDVFYFAGKVFFFNIYEVFTLEILKKSSTYHYSFSLNKPQFLSLLLLCLHIAVHNVLFVPFLGLHAEVFNWHKLYLTDMLTEAKPEPISLRMTRQRALYHPEIHIYISVPVSGCDLVFGVQTVFDAVYLDAVIVEHQF